MMIIPPLSLPFGGQIKRINTDELEYASTERSRSSTNRSLPRHTNQNIKTVKIDS